MRSGSTAASRWPRDGSALDLLDKRLSMPVFTLRLSRTLENCLAFPGCLFGMPAFGAPAALVIALVTGGGTRAAWIVTALLLLAIAGAWAAVLFTPTGLRKARILYSPSTVLLTPWLALGLLRADALGLAGGGAGCLYLVTWFACIAPTLAIKALTRRRRPLACEAEHVGEACVGALACKEPRAIVRMLRRDANASFPSGDVAGAVCFARALCGCSGALGGAPGCGGGLGGLGAPAAAACVLLSALGRMYWQAHHLLDVLVGCALSVATCTVVDGATGGGDGVRWWHLATAQASVFVLALGLRSVPPAVGGLDAAAPRTR